MTKVPLRVNGLLLGASLLLAAGCASTAGWGPAPPATPAQIAAAHGGAPAFRSTSAIGSLAKNEKAVQVPPNVRVQDCAIVATSSPTRFACDGKVYTSFQLARAREKAAGN